MMDILAPIAKQQGFEPDNIVCSNEVPAGRPDPWMIFKNMMDLQTYPSESVVKIGDTIVDITEGFFPPFIFLVFFSLVALFFFETLLNDINCIIYIFFCCCL